MDSFVSPWVPITWPSFLTQVTLWDKYPEVSVSTWETGWGWGWDSSAPTTVPLFLHRSFLKHLLQR